METPRFFAGFSLERRPLVMGIVNVTPDSFSDGGDRYDAAAAIAAGREMLEAGADILDIGGESTRPGAEPLGIEEECARVLPVVAALAEAGAAISIDSRHAMVMRAAMEMGARLVNDVTALTGDPDSLETVAELKVPVVLMHMQGEPRTMQSDPRYGDVVREVRDYLGRRAEACTAAGIAHHDIAIDPGVGFGKTVEHNLSLLRHLDSLAELGYPVLLGASRKAFIGKLSQGEAPKQRLAGSLAVALAAAERGAAILRVHDVAETVQALKIWRAIASAP
ncbi:MAG: dihydropteroate synthase [Rhodovibrionaceae bacterium]